jgi:hypothetical protein
MYFAFDFGTYSTPSIITDFKILPPLILFFIIGTGFNRIVVTIFPVIYQGAAIAISVVLSAIGWGINLFQSITSFLE